MRPSFCTPRARRSRSVGHRSLEVSPKQQPWSIGCGGSPTWKKTHGARTQASSWLVAPSQAATDCHRLLVSASPTRQQDVRCKPRTLDARLGPCDLESKYPRFMSAPSRDEPHREPLSAGSEYAALAGFLGQVNGFRFAVLGLFLTAAGFVLSRPTRSTAALILALSFLLWATELRTRAILLALVDRGKELEAGRKPDEEAGAHKLFAHIHDSRDQEMNIGPHGREGAPRRHSLPWFVTHTFTIDLIYLVVAVYSALVLVLGPENL
jgi:hypothetical protein